MAIAGTGQYGLPMQELADALAELTAFQAWAGAADAAAAAEHIFLAHHEDADRAAGESDAEYLAGREALRPLVVLTLPHDHAAGLRLARRGYTGRGTVRCVFEDLADPDDLDLDTRNSIVRLANHVGAIVEELESAEDRPEIQQHRRVTEPGRMAATEIGRGEVDCVRVAVELEVGI